MKSKYMNSTAQRREVRTVTGTFRGGKLAPVMIVPFRESESGVLQQSVVFELDPIAGRMITPITAEVISVYVPAQAMHALDNPESDYPGNAEVMREILLSGASLFDTRSENRISKMMGVVPRRIAGTPMVSKVAHLAHNSAVNYLRQRKFVNAELVAENNVAITPAIIGQTVLDRLNGVLDPEDRINGSVQFEGELKVHGVGIKTLPEAGSEQPADYYQLTAKQEVMDSGGTTYDSTGAEFFGEDEVGGQQLVVKEDEANRGFPDIYADLGGSNSVSLKDFYQAEQTDRITRYLREMVDANPQYGEEMVARYAHGLSIDPGKQPFVIYEKQHVFGQSMQRAMDGANLDKTQTNSVAEISFAVPVPATEFGGAVVTFAVVKPDETLESQPHPILSTEWGARNYVADELAVDPVPVTIRELDGDCDLADEETVALYVGNNQLLKTYQHYGLNREVDPTTVENRTALWQLKVPMSVTPQSVIYPENLNHYPFADQNAEICTYTISSNTRINTPIIFGPTPVEELAAIETSDIFEDA